MKLYLFVLSLCLAFSLTAQDSVVLEHPEMGWKQIIRPFGTGRCEISEYIENKLRLKAYANCTPTFFDANQGNQLDSLLTVFDANGMVQRLITYQNGKITCTQGFDKGKQTSEIDKLLETDQSFTTYQTGLPHLRIDFRLGSDIFTQFKLNGSILVSGPYARRRWFSGFRPENAGNNYFRNWYFMDETESWLHFLYDPQHKLMSQTNYDLNMQQLDSLSVELNNDSTYNMTLFEGNQNTAAGKIHVGQFWYDAYFHEIEGRKNVRIHHRMDNRMRNQIACFADQGDSFSISIIEHGSEISKWKNGVLLEKEIKSRSINEMIAFEFNAGDFQTVRKFFSEILNILDQKRYDRHSNTIQTKTYYQNGNLRTFSGTWNRNPFFLIFDSTECSDYVLPNPDSLFVDKDMKTCHYGLRTAAKWLTPPIYNELNVLNQYHFFRAMNQLLFRGETEETVDWMDQNGKVILSVNEHDEDRLVYLNEPLKSLWKVQQPFVIADTFPGRIQIRDLAQHQLFELNINGAHFLPELRRNWILFSKKGISYCYDIFQKKEIRLGPGIPVQIEDSLHYAILYQNEKYYLQTREGFSVPYLKSYFTGDTALCLVQDSGIMRYSLVHHTLTPSVRYSQLPVDFMYEYFDVSSKTEPSQFRYHGKVGIFDPKSASVLQPAVFDQLNGRLFRKGRQHGLFDNTFTSMLISDADSIISLGSDKHPNFVLVIKNQRKYLYKVMENSITKIAEGDQYFVGHRRGETMMFDRGNLVWQEDGDHFLSNFNFGEFTIPHEEKCSGKLALISGNNLITNPEYDQIDAVGKMPQQSLLKLQFGETGQLFELKKGFETWNYSVLTGRLTKGISARLKQQMGDKMAWIDMQGVLHLKEMNGDEIPLPKGCSHIATDHEFVWYTTEKPKSRNDNEYDASHWYLTANGVPVPSIPVCNLPMKPEDFGNTWCWKVDNARYIITDKSLNRIVDSVFYGVKRTEYPEYLYANLHNQMYLVETMRKQLIPLPWQRVFLRHGTVYAFENNRCINCELSTQKTDTSEHWFAETTLIPGSAGLNKLDRLLRNVPFLSRSYNSSVNLHSYWGNMYEQRLDLFPTRSYYLDSFPETEPSEGVDAYGDIGPAIGDSNGDYDYSPGVSKPLLIKGPENLPASFPDQCEQFKTSCWMLCKPYQNYEGPFNLFFDTIHLNVYQVTLSSLLTESGRYRLDSFLYQFYKDKPKLNFPCTKNNSLTKVFNRNFRFTEKGIQLIDPKGDWSEFDYRWFRQFVNPEYLSWLPVVK